jgi:hypothetical protein
MNKAENCDQGAKGDGAAALARIESALAGNADQRPVWAWHPEREVSLDIHIEADGTWNYLGTPILRPRLVKLFASVLRREEDGSHCLVTPAEKVSIRVDDAPFLAVHMDVAGEGEAQVIGFRTNVDDYVRADAGHPMRFAVDEETGGTKPYVTVRNGLEALVTRALAHDLLDLCVDAEHDGEPWLGVWSAGTFFPVMRKGDLA